MKTVLLILAVLTATALAGQLFVIPDGTALAEQSHIIVYRTPSHVVAFGTPTANSRVLSETDGGLERFAMVTVKNDNGVLQTTELGSVLYRNGNTLIVQLHNPLNGGFRRPDVFHVAPLRETLAPAEPIPVPVRSGYDDTIADIVTAVSEDSLISITYNYQSYLTRYSNTDGYDTACDWSNDRFLSHGLDSEIQYFSMMGYQCQNVVAIQQGTLYPDQYWMICGHLDSTSPNTQYDAPGADDNGSGSAAVVEAARIMSQYDFEYSVIYALWGGEEQGLHGSAHYADSAAAAGMEIHGVVNLDMIFYGPPPDDQAELHYNTASTGLGLAFDAISDTYVPSLEKTVANPPVSASDHSSFWNAGYPAMLSIEKEVWNNPYYHQTSDLMDNYLEYFPFGTDMARAAIATVAYLATPVNTSIEENHSGVPEGGFGLAVNANPVRGAASLTVSLPGPGTVALGVFDLTGRQVLSSGEELSGGLSQVSLATETLPPGMYLVRAESMGNTVTARMIIAR